MLSHENYTKAHINDVWIETGADPSILERTIFAFGLRRGASKPERVNSQASRRSNPAFTPQVSYKAN